jgi:hypothetical protein
MLLDLKLAQPPQNVGVFLSAWCYWYVTAKDFRYGYEWLSSRHIRVEYIIAKDQIMRTYLASPAVAERDEPLKIPESI